MRAFGASGSLVGRWLRRWLRETWMATMTASMFMTLDGVVDPGQQLACPALQRRAG